MFFCETPRRRTENENHRQEPDGSKHGRPRRKNTSDDNEPLNMDKKKVLIVDDKEQIAKILFVYLNQEYDCFYMQNPLQAIAWLLGGNMPDLIISDIRMPEMRGDEFLAYLKHNELLKQIPVVMLSSEDSTSERIRLLEQGAEDYIVKPFNPMELKIRVTKIMR